AQLYPDGALRPPEFPPGQAGPGAGVLTDRCPQNLHDNSDHESENNYSEPEILPDVRQVSDSNERE
ncbi:MAG TPA: hypothetical protein VMV92_07735, partial [Streptosporangiaceae bacterium]|nr:hypothetical protein [Streptosporangiaceae bacterium]